MLLTIISARLGHSQVATTADIYQHALPGLDREAAVRMAAVLFRVEGGGTRDHSEPQDGGNQRA